MSEQKDTHIVKSHMAYIDPLDCDSTVGYKIIERVTHPEGKLSVTGDVRLSDCNRTISWYFGGDSKDQISKIDNAIEMLYQFRKKLNEALIRKDKNNAKLKAKVKK